ncbi:MAG: TraX family protein [Candidatus Levyibacteriota bacterium]
MSAFQIKVLAIVTMILDHMGLFFFPHFVILRLIGRISFPLFAWLIANGARHTHNGNLYLLRLTLFAIIAQIPFIMANQLLDPSFFELNVLFTLSFGLIAILFIQRTQNRYLWLLISVLACISAYLLKSDYGASGVLEIIAFYLFFNNFRSMLLAQGVIFLGDYVLSPHYATNLSELLGLFSLIFIYCYNSKPGVKVQYLFYLFYPLQYVFFYLQLKNLLH